MYTPPVTLMITSADTGETEAYVLTNGQYRGANTGKLLDARLFPYLSPQAVDTTLADFDEGQVPGNWFSQWSATQTFLTQRLITEALQWAIAMRTGGHTSGGFGRFPLL